MVLTLLQPPTEKQYLYLASVTFVAGKTKTPSKSVDSAYLQSLFVRENFAIKRTLR